MNDYILQVTDLKTYFKLDTGTLKAVDDVTFHLKGMKQSALSVSPAAEKA